MERGKQKRTKTNQHAYGFFKNAEDVQIWMRGSIQKHRDGMEDNEAGEIQSILAATCQIAIELVVNAVS